MAACATTGTDYVDLTGEAEFVDRTWLRHHRTAERSGARLVHACGFDSIPHDLGALFTVSQLPEGVPLSVHAYVRTNAGSPAGQPPLRSGSSPASPRGSAPHSERERLEGRAGTRP